MLGPEETVLTEVREGKWLEGLTGRATLFSQPVRYAFRPAEWQRGTDAVALLRSSQTVTSGYVAVQFTERVGDLPTGMILRANHRGEFVDLLRIPPSATQITGHGDTVTAAGLVPLRARQRVTELAARSTTVWGRVDDPQFTFTQAVTAFRDGTTLRLTQTAPGHRLAIDLLPILGMEVTALQLDVDEATLCFTQLGASSPCLGVRVAEPGASLAANNDGGLHVTSGTSGRLDVLVTALSAGDAANGLELLEPAEVVERYDVGAALLFAGDPAYASRARRLESLGFTEGPLFGPYRVLLREDVASP
jgi:hypothetical protein